MLVQTYCYTLHTHTQNSLCLLRKQQVSSGSLLLKLSHRCCPFPYSTAPCQHIQCPGELTQTSCFWNTIYRSPSCLAKFILLLQQPFSLAPLGLATSCIACKKEVSWWEEWEGESCYGKGNLQGEIHLDLYKLYSQRDPQGIFKQTTLEHSTMNLEETRKEKRAKGNTSYSVFPFELFSPKDNATYFITALLQEN